MYLVNVLLGEAAAFTKELRQYESEFYAQLDLEGIDYDGSGVSLCMVDSGIDVSHSAFKSLELKGWRILLVILKNQLMIMGMAHLWLDLLWQMGISKELREV